MAPSPHHHPLVTRIDDVTPTGSTTSRFDGADHGSQASFYVSRDVPGSGPDLHTHPYTETFVIEAGQVRFTVGDEVIDVAAGDVLVVPADTAHGFTCIGSEAMRSVNIHAAAPMVQHDLPCRRRDDGSWQLLA
jgi:quercetin dioxygenase-like cupin family protein